jgi:2-C-methyl-D-erythritol 4-phosphate cytidylyltransferase
MDRIAAIALGAGSGVRLGRTVNKIYLRIGDEPVIVRAARALGDHPLVDDLYVVAAPDELELCRDTLARAGVRVAGIIPGGSTRHASELAALEAIAPLIESGEIGLVLIHDGARPLLDEATITRTIAGAREHGAAIAALPVEPSLAVVRDDILVDTRPTDGLWQAQTPQAFAARPLLDAFRQAFADGFEGTDTAMSLERAGVPVHVVAGDARNLKVTYPADLMWANALLAESGAR